MFTKQAPLKKRDLHSALRTHGPPHHHQPEDWTPRLQDWRHRSLGRQGQEQERVDEADEEEGIDPGQAMLHVQKVLRLPRLDEASVAASQDHHFGQYPSVGEGHVRSGRLQPRILQRQGPRHVLPHKRLALLPGGLGAFRILRLRCERARVVAAL